MRLGDREVDPWGNVILDHESLADQLMMGHELSGEILAQPSDRVQRYNDLCGEWDHPQDRVGIYQEPSVTVEQWDQDRQSRWFLPSEYQDLDVREWLLMRCHTEEQVSRVLEEWEMFEERDMINLLRTLVFLVDDLRSRGIVWGVGRGSSVASYCLFLIGVHRIDSMRYDLDIHEFLK